MKIGVMLRTIDEKQGIGVYTQNLMDRLLPLDTKNEYVLFYRTSEHLGRYAQYDHVNEILMSGSSKAVWDQLKVPIEAKRHGVDLIFNTKFTVPLFTAAKTVMSLHGSAWYVNPEAYPFLDRASVRVLMPRYCNKADRIISNSEMTKRDFVNFVGVDEDKITTSYFGFDPRFRPVVDDSLLERIRQEYQLPQKFVLFVGGIYPGKNFGNLLKAFSLIHTTFPQHIVVAGQPRWGYKNDFALIDELGLQEKVHLTGWVSQEDLVAFYNLADLFIYPSFYEAFGIPLLEAMACGCPVVSSTTGAVPEIANGAALLADPQRPDEIAPAISSGLTEDGLRQDLIEKGLCRVKDFSWEKCAQETLNVLEGALEHG